MATSGESHNSGVAVFCAASLGGYPEYKEAAQSVGRAIAASGRSLVYGGGSHGLMGVVSGAVLEGGGKVTGIIPYAMVRAGGEGNAYVDLSEEGRETVQTIVVNSMHERKEEMAKRVGAFIGLAGGFGTLEEIMEITTWLQLGIHQKPVIILNIRGYFDPLRALIQGGIREGFIPAANEKLFTIVDDPRQNPDTADVEWDWGIEALKAIEAWQPIPQGYSYDWAARKPEEEEGGGAYKSI